MTQSEGRVEHLPVAAQGVSLQDGVEVLDAVKPSEIEVGQGEAAVHAVQRGEDARIATGPVVGYQGPAHVVVRPAVEAVVGRALGFPVEERLAPLEHAVNDKIEARSGLVDEEVVVQGVAQPYKTIEPVSGLLERPTGAVGLDPGDIDGLALPALAERGVVLVEMARDPVARRRRPVAKPPPRLHGARRKGLEPAGWPLASCPRGQTAPQNCDHRSYSGALT